MVPREEKRRIPTSEQKIIEPLVEGMGKPWWRCAPPASELARSIVYGYSFLSIRKLSPFFPEVLGKRKLVDLGAGTADAMTHFATRCGVGRYVAVDRYLDYSGRIPLLSNVSFVNSDMLMFLAEQPDNSANISMIAIDHIVLSGSDSITEALYQKMLLAQIQRVVPLGGIAFGFNSEILHGLTDLGFERIEKIPGYPSMKRYFGGGIYIKQLPV